jgi:hypothetical protein
LLYFIFINNFVPTIIGLKFWHLAKLISVCTVPFWDVCLCAVKLVTESVSLNEFCVFLVLSYIRTSISELFIWFYLADQEV